MFKKFLLLGVAFLATTAASTLGADSSKIRLLVPVQGTATGDAMTKTANPAGTTEKITPSGYSVHYVASAGWGIGYTSHSYEQELSVDRGELQETQGVGGRARRPSSL